MSQTVGTVLEDFVIPILNANNGSCDHSLNISLDSGYHPSIYITLIIGIIGIGLLGIVWNIIGLCVLLRPSMRTPLNILMIVLCVFDLVNIIVFVSVFILPNALAFLDVERLSVLNWKASVFPYAYPTARIATFGSTYFTVLITLERYYAVCKPLKVSKLCCMKNTVKAAVLTVIGVFAYNIPRFWKLRTVKICDEPLMYDVDSAERGFFSSVEFVTVYYVLGSFITFCAIPFVLLVFFNGKIFKVLKNQKFLRDASAKKEAEQLRSLAYMLFCIVGLSLVVVITDLYVTFHEMFIDGNFYDLTHFFLVWYDPLLVLNSTMNFVFYCIFGRKFRREMLQLFCASYASTFANEESSTRTLSEVADARNATELNDMVVKP